MARWVRSRRTLLALLVLAFALRIALLDRRPLHFDEGNSIYFAWVGWDRLLADALRTGETDPMGHRLSMGLWMRFAGITPFAVRVFSVFFGVASMALLARVLRALRASAITTLLACALLAAGAGAIDYSQQAKGYAMGACMALLAWWMWIRLCGASGLRSQISFSAIYSLALALMLSTHHYTAPVFGMHWLWWAGSVWQWGRVAWRTVQRGFWMGLLAQVLACLPNAAWAAVSLPAVIAGSLGLSGGLPASLTGFLQRLFGEWAVGASADPWLASLGAFVFGGLLLMGFGRGLHNRQQRALVWFGASLLMPVTFSFVLQHPVTFFHPRFLLYALPNALALVALAVTPSFKPNYLRPRGFRGEQIPPPTPPFKGGQSVPPPIGGEPALRLPTGLGVLVRSAGLMLTLLLCAAGAVAFYRAPIDTLNDYRPLMEKLRRWVQPGDVVLGTYIWMPAMLDSYAPELRGRYAWREDFASIDNANRLMPIATQGAARVWSLNYIRNPDAPDVGAVTWLRRELAYADREASGTLSALLFARVPNAADSQTARITIFDKRIRMEVVRASGTLAQGHSIEAAMRFTALETLEGAVAISLQLVDADGVLIAQNDGDAVNGLAPSFSWRPNEPVLDRRALLVREPLPRGQYALRLAIYDRSTGNRWPTEMGAGFVQLGAFAAD